MAAGSKLALFTEGSLLKRTLVSVGTFVVGSVVFLGILSLVLVSIARGVMPTHGDQDKTGKDDDKSEASPGASVIKPGLPKARGKRKGATEPVATAAPAAEDPE